jgi:predicted small lipoprotein YifL
MRLKASVPVALGLLALAGCGSTGPASTSASATVQSPAPTQSSSTTKASAPATTASEAEKFHGIDRGNYDDAKSTCSVFSPAKIARDLHVKDRSDIVAIAQAFAHGYRPAHRQAPYEGCLAALKAAG